MLELRPIVVNDEMIVLGGNMRLKALEHLGIEETFIIKAGDLTDKQEQEFIIKDTPLCYLRIFLFFLQYF